MNVFQSHPPPRFHQALLGTWTLVDPSNVVSTVTDGPGYTDVQMTTNTGAFFFTKSIADFLGESVDASTAFFSVQGLVQELAGPHPVGFELSFGLCDNADPNAGGALFESYGYQYNGVDYTARRRTEATSGNGSTGIFDRLAVQLEVNGGYSGYSQFGLGFNGSTLVANAGQTLAARAFTPTHLLVRYNDGSAAGLVRRLGVGIDVGRPIPALEITPRV